MPWFDFIWTEDNEEHVSQHDLTIDEVEQVVMNPVTEGTSRTSGRPMVQGVTYAGKLITVVYELIDDVTVYVVTAFENEN